jgi:N-acetylglucosaminyl-diphospho-decaprenol L-rhamnosyltransferase
MKAVVDIVIVAYRSRELVRACLTSLRDHSSTAPTSVWVVDNASADGTVAMVEASFPEVRVIASETNLGFGTANNLAIREGNAEYVLALNPDTRLTEGALDKLLALMAARPEIGICGCALLQEDGSPDHAARRSFPTVAGALGHFARIGRSDRAPRALAQYRAPDVSEGPVDAVNGAFMLMRRSALEEVGLFDEGYWMYMEDLDLCYRFQQAGWITWYEPKVTVWHVKGGTTGRVRDARLTYAFHYGMYRFYRKHYAPERNPIANAVVYGGIAAKLAVSVLVSTGKRLAARS